MTRADMHIHTYYSDGCPSPAEVAEEAQKNGVNFLTLTDHDSSLGYEEIQKECLARNIRTVIGIEVSAYIGDVKIHTLGYGFDADSSLYKEFYKGLYEGSVKRMEDILFALNQNGVKLTAEDVFAQRKSALSPVHAMHIARAGAAKGYCNGKADEFFFQYLAWGRCGYSVVCRPTPEQTIEVINACGGITSLAHPARISMEKQPLTDLIKKLKACGLYAIEANYSGHNKQETQYYKEVAQKLGLIETGGSDTHYFGGWRKIGMPEFYLSQPLKERLGI